MGHSLAEAPGRSDPQGMARTERIQSHIPISDCRGFSLAVRRWRGRSLVRKRKDHHHKRSDEGDYIQNLMDWQEHQYIPNYFINDWRMRLWFLRNLGSPAAQRSPWGWAVILIGVALEGIALSRQSIYFPDWREILGATLISAFLVAVGTGMLQKAPRKSPGRNKPQ